MTGSWKLFLLAKFNAKVQGRKGAIEWLIAAEADNADEIDM
jgi:hypothetical protein